MKKYFSLIFITAVLFAEPLQLKNFEEFYESILSGNEVKVVIHYAKTNLIVDDKPEAAPDVIGGMNIDSYEYFAAGTARNDKEFISTSKSVLIKHPVYGYVLNYVKMRIYDDETVQIVAQYINPVTFEVKMDKTFKGAINDGKNNEGIYFYQL